MDERLKLINGLICLIVMSVLTLHAPVFAKGKSVSEPKHGKQKYIVILDDPPLAAYDGRIMHTPEREMESARFQATANRFTGAKKLDANSLASKRYLKFLDERFEAVRGESALRLGRQLKAKRRFRNAVNGFSVDLNKAEVEAISELPGVQLVIADKVHKPNTDSSASWLGADKIYQGTAGPFPSSGGEGIVVGIIDFGINWDHNSFVDPGEGGSPGYDHVNPFGTQLGLCSKSEVLCNDKLIGVYDFVEDDPGTEAIEENTDGRDNDGHGSHVASIAAGNPLSLTLNEIPVIMNGIAANANIVSYRVCHIGDPADSSDDGCLTSHMISAMDQAITDNVDVVNISIGTIGFPEDPWLNGTMSRALLNVRAAGIFAVTSGGNDGPISGSTLSPANAPWVVAVGSASHDRVFANAVESLSGGDTPPPNALIGASYTEGIDIRNIVHAKDYGSALCGTGQAQSGPDCASNTGLSSPFAPGTFNGEIVICDRGEYGRVEKGKNLLLAGAGGYILANTDEWGESIHADEHCLPATHLGFEDSEQLRDWQGSGSNHQGGLSGFSIFHIAEAGDRINYFSSRGPLTSSPGEILKPDLIAPGADILGAGSVDNNFLFLSGSSMSSPQVAGSAALLKSVHPEWTPEMLGSALMMTATAELAIDHDDSEATPFKRGTGRPRLDQAVNAGLFLDESVTNFLLADPDIGGDPKTLNLPGLVNMACHNTCSFSRTVTDLAGGANWTSSTSGFDNSVSVSVSPSSFNLSKDSSQELMINIDLRQSELLGQWIYGEVLLSSSGLPDAVFTVAIFADGGELPLEWKIESTEISGSQEFELNGLAALPDATYTSGGLVMPTEMMGLVPQDPTEFEVYDGSAGTMTFMHTVPANALWLHTATLHSTSVDLDLFVGLDVNGDGKAQPTEQLCASTSPTEIELCDVFSPVAGEYWIMVQNFRATNAEDQFTLKSAVVSQDTSVPLTASGDGKVANGANQKIRVAWDNVSAVPGTELFGAVGIGSRRETPNNIGVVPVSFNKTAVAEPKTLVLMNGLDRGLTLNGNGTHDRIFFDIPPGTDTFTVSTTADGIDPSQNEALTMELYRADFDNAFTNAPFVAAADTSGAPLGTATGSGDTGPTLTVSGANAAPGRWFAVLKNSSNANADVRITADISFSGTPVPLKPGLWQASSRENLSQGYDYSSTGGYRAFLWYTYDDDGSPVWYLASGPEAEGNIWVAELLRFTNDGTLQHSTPVGHVSITMLAEEDQIFSFVLFGEDGSDRERPSLPPVCPEVDGTPRSYYGLWSRLAEGVGGSTVVVNETSQAFVHYIFDDAGRPVWLIGTPSPQSATNPESTLLQFDGFCAVCSEKPVTIETVGLFTRELISETTMTWNLDYTLKSPLSGSIDRTDNTIKLTAPVACQ